MTMTKSKIIVAGCVILSAFLIITGCDKQPYDKITNEVTDYSNSSTLQFYNAVVEANRNYLYNEGRPLNGSSLILGSSFPSNTYNSAAPSLGNSFLSTTGIHTFQLKDTSSTTTQVPMTFTENLQAGTYYTVFAYDTITNPKVKIVETKIEVPADLNTSRVRLANFIYAPNSVVVPAIDIFSVKKNANLFTGINKTDVTDFISIPANINDTLIVRATGTTTALAQFNSFIPTPKRSYTMVFRGRYGLTGTANAARQLAIFSNY